MGLSKEVLAVFKKHKETGAEGDCFGFYRNMETIECKGCEANKKCGEIKAELSRLHLLPVNEIHLVPKKKK